MSTRELLEALNGPKGSLDSYLEIRNDAEIKADILALVASTSNSKREHFAGLAMQAIIGTAATPCLTSFDGCEPNIAQTAVGMADALIAELEKSK